MTLLSHGVVVNLSTSKDEKVRWSCRDSNPRQQNTDVRRECSSHCAALGLAVGPQCEGLESDEACLNPRAHSSMGSIEEQESEEGTILGGGQNESAATGEDIPTHTSMPSPGFSEPNVASSTGLQCSGARPGFAAFHHLRKKRKGLRSRNPLDKLLLKSLSLQQSMEEGLLQLEERRLQRDIEMEERRMHLEQRRLEQDREHEFRMFSVFAQMLTILKRGSGPSTPPTTSPVGQDLVQLFSDMANSGLGGIVSREAWPASSPAVPVVTPSTQDNSSLSNSSQYQNSPFLSARGNLLSGLRGSSEEGYNAYHEDKYDEEKNPNGIINFGTSENKLCFDLMSKRLTQSDMNHVEPPLLQYPDWKGHMFLREEVAHFLTYYCKSPTPLNAENVVVLNGCGSTFSSLASVLCDPGDAVLIATPFYGGITHSIFLYSNVKLVYIHLDSKICGQASRPFQLTVEKMEKALQKATSEVLNPVLQPLQLHWKAQAVAAALRKPYVKGTVVKALFLLNPHNPLGEVYSLAEMKEFLEFAKRHNLHVVVDEIYMLSVFEESEMFQSVLSMEKLPDPMRTHVMWGISKDFAVSGIRFGTLYSQNQDVCNGVASLCYFHGVCGPTQYKIAQLLRDKDWINQVFLRTNHARLRAAKAYVTEELQALGVPFLNRNAGFFVWIDFRKYLRTDTFEEEVMLWRHFLDNKVLLSCGKAFECCEPGWFRIIFADKTQRLQLGMQRIRKVLEEREQKMLAEERNQQAQVEPDGKADSADEVIYVSSHQEPSNSNLGDLIGLLRQQMRSSDWLQKNTVEQFAQENPEVFDVFTKTMAKK